MFHPIVESHAELSRALSSRERGRPERESLLELFHENTKYTRAHPAARFGRIAESLQSRRAVEALSHNFKVYRFAEKLALPNVEPPGASLGQALAKRVSTRVFSGEPVTLSELASVLVPAAACHRTAAVKEFPPIELQLRSYPSGGAEFPVEIYPVLLRVAGSPPGVTHFDPRSRALSVLGRSVAGRELPRALMNGEAILSGAAALIVLTAIFERSAVKYGDRAYRLILLEAGHLAQNLALTASAAGLGTLAWGGYYDDELNALLGVDGLHEAVVHCLFLGKVSS